MRLIDADRLLEIFKERKKPNYHENIGAYLQWLMSVNAVEEAPTLKDAPMNEEVQIVRCKYCIYNKRNTDATNENWCYHFGYDVELYDFCSHGERI